MSYAQSFNGLRFGWHALFGAALIAGCSQPGKVRQDPATSGRPAGEQTSIGVKGNQQDPRSSPEQPSAPELWFFLKDTPERMAKFNARGVRTIIDLRVLKTETSIEWLRKLADQDFGAAICLRWANTEHEGPRPVGKENFDVPPTANEAARAMEQLREIVTSEPAKRMGSRLYVQFYNEIGSGPGRFDLEHSDAMFDFATRAVRMLRRENPKIQICGAAHSGGVLHMVERAYETPERATRAEGVLRAIKWTAQNADVLDVHLNGINVDDDWAGEALQIARDALDANGGQKVGLVSFEWSCSGYPARDDEGIRKRIHSIWEAMEKHQVRVAAYTYWPLMARPEDVRSRTSWASVMNENLRPNHAVAETLVEIGASGTKK